MTPIYARFLPRDAMPAQYILSSCVCLSICPSVTRRYYTYKWA